MKSAARALDAFARLWRWGDKWLVHIWLGIPLLSGFLGWWGGGLDQYQDLGEYAARAPRIERHGLIKDTDIRGRKQVLISGDERIGITCSFPPDSGCIKYITPIKGKVKYFKYNDANIIVDLRSDDGRHLVKEKERVGLFVKGMRSYREHATLNAVLWMVFFSLYLVVPLVIGIPIIRWIGKRNLKKRDGRNAR